MTDAGRYTTFVVRLSRPRRGRLDGVVERVRTGEKVRFHELDALGAVIAGMLADPGRPGRNPDRPKTQEGEDSHVECSPLPGDRAVRRSR